MRYERYTYPPYGAPLMEAYGAGFESVYVILHPFVSVPDDLGWKATKAYPSDEQIASLGGKCTWAQVAAETGLRTCSKVNQALLTSIRSIGEELCDYPASSALRTFLEAGSRWMPGEGRFEPLLQLDFLDVFEATGQRELVFVPEFPSVDPIQQLSVARLRSCEDAFPYRGTLVAPDESFLLTVDWDSFFTLLFGPREFVAEMVRRHNLEGFFATPTTEHFWFNYSFGCSIVTVAPEGWAAS
ncbi:MAG TPA: DUF2711 family protein [Terracidiphilus sp.]|nr:DUF2711 family protein [Terracidiphilus sp.]